MDYEKIEGLVVQAKLGYEKAKEELVAEFTPLILNISKKSFIDSYEFYKSKLNVAMKKLNNNDRELIDFIYFKNNTFKSYSKIKGIPYSTVIMRKNIILNELKEMLGLHNGNNLLN